MAQQAIPGRARDGVSRMRFNEEVLQTNPAALKRYQFKERKNSQGQWTCTMTDVQTQQTWVCFAQTKKEAKEDTLTSFFRQWDAKKQSKPVEHWQSTNDWLGNLIADSARAKMESKQEEGEVPGEQSSSLSMNNWFQKQGYVLPTFTEIGQGRLVATHPGWWPFWNSKNRVSSSSGSVSLKQAKQDLSVWIMDHVKDLFRKDFIERPIDKSLFEFGEGKDEKIWKVWSSSSVKITYTTDAKVVDTWISEWCPSSTLSCVQRVGMDCEAYQGLYLCTIQLSVAKACLVYTIRASSQSSVTLSKQLVDLLEDNKTRFKVLVDARHDKKWLQEFPATKTIRLAGLVDLAEEAECLGTSQNAGLARMVKHYLGWSLEDMPNYQLYDWRQDLYKKDEAIRYAAMDAWLAYMLSCSKDLVPLFESVLNV